MTDDDAMLPLAEGIGIERLGHWVTARAFNEYGKYESSDAMTAAARLADWVETSALFGEARIVSKTRISDHVGDSGLACDDETPELIGDEILSELRVRERLFHNDGYPFTVDGELLRAKCDWNTSSVYAFLLLASNGHLNPWVCNEGTSYDQVGHLFEDLVRVACEGLFGAIARRIPVTGRAKNNRLHQRMKDVLRDFGRVPHPELARQPRKIKDGGLDVLARAVLPNHDSRGASPHVLVQCAAGANWESKLDAPVADLWRAWVHWRGPIWRAFAVPTLLDDDSLSRASAAGSWTFLLDRARLVEGVARTAVPAELLAQLTKWLQGRRKALQRRGLRLCA